MKKLIAILLVLAVLASLIAVLPVKADTPGSLQRVVITPSTVTLLPGGTQQFSAQGQDDDHVPITNLTYTWAVVAGGGTISNTGLFTAANVPGSFKNTVMVAASQGSTVKVNFASVSIPGPLDHVIITPSTATLKVGGTKQFSAQGYDASNLPISNLTYSWSVVAGGGTISNTGLFTAGNVGGSFPNTVLVATTQGAITRTANASVTIESPGPLQRVVITPSTVNLLGGGTQQFSAQGYDGNRVPIPNLTYTWAVVAGGGTINNTGLFTAGSLGGSFPNTVLVAASQGSTVKVDYASVNITPVPGPLDHVVITPNTVNLKVGSTKQFSAKGYDASNVSIPNLIYSWSVIAGGGTINITGLFTAGNMVGSFPNTVLVATTQGAITKTAYASVTVEPLPVPPTTLKLDGTKLLMLVAGTVGVTDFDNFLGAQWTIRDNGQLVTVEAVPGKVNAIDQSSITIVPNGQTAPQTFTISTQTKILADKKKGVLVSKQVVVVVAGDTTWLIAQMTTSQMKKLFPSGWFNGKKLGWYKWLRENDRD